jgi:O-antigen ligase
VVTAIGGVLVAYDRPLTWPILMVLLGSVTIFLLIATAPIEPRFIARGLVLAGGLLALYFIGQFGHFGFQEATGIFGRLGQLTGSLLPRLGRFAPHPNAVAGFLEGVWLVNFALIWRERHAKPWIWGLTAAIMAYALLISGSRGAWVGLAVALGIWLLLHFRNRVSPAVQAGVGLAIGVLLGFYLVSYFVLPGQNSLFLNSIFTNADTRYSLYQNSLSLIRDYPFTGIGPGGTFAMVYSRYQLFHHVPYLYYAHNIFLSVGLGQGILGIVALVWLFVDFYRYVFRVDSVGLSPQLLPIFRAAWLGTTASLVHGLVDSVQFSPDHWTMLMLFALAGLTVLSGRPAWQNVERTKAGGRPFRKGWIWLAGMTVVVLVAAAIFWRPISVAWYTNWGAVYQTQAELSPRLTELEREVATARAVSNFERALSLDPSHAGANRRLGLLALDQRDYASAIVFLRQAYAEEPHNQATLKTLGYAYLWAGQTDLALKLFQQVEIQSLLVAELEYWQWWYGEQDQEQLSVYAEEMVRRLAAVNDSNG